MNNLLFLASLLSDEKNAKITRIVLIILLFTLVVVGLIAGAIEKGVNAESKKIDLYLSDMCNYRILVDEKSLVKYATKRENKSLYLKNRWFLRIMFLLIIGFVLLMKFKYNNDYSQVLQILKDLTFKFESPKGNFYFFKNFPLDWPVLVKKSEFHLDLLGYSTYILLLDIIVTFVAIIRNSLGCVAKISRAKKNQSAYFNNNPNLK